VNTVDEENSVEEEGSNIGTSEICEDAEVVPWELLKDDEL